MAKKYRIEVSSNLHKALKIMAAKEGLTVKAYATKTLSAAVDLKTWDYMDEETKDPRIIHPPDERPKLAENQEALEEIKRLWWRASDHRPRLRDGSVIRGRRRARGSRL